MNKKYPSKSMDDELTQELLYNKYILPYEEDIIKELKRNRDEYDKIMWEIVESVWLNNPYVKKKDPSTQRWICTFFDYPDWHCREIRDFIYQFVWKEWENIHIWIWNQNKRTINSDSIIPQIELFRNMWWIVEKVHLIVDLNDPYFQNVIRIWNRYLDTSADQNNDWTKPKIKLIKIKWQKTYREIKDFDDDIKIDKLYRWTYHVINTWFTWFLSLFIPYISIDNYWQLLTPPFSLIEKNVKLNFRLSKNLLNREYVNQSIYDIPEDIRQNLIFACKVAVDSTENENEKKLILDFLIRNLENKKSIDEIKKETHKYYSHIKKYNKTILRDFAIIYTRIIEKIIDIYNDLLRNWFFNT